MDASEENSPSSMWVMPPQPSPPRQPATASSRPSDSELPAKRDLFKARIHYQAEDLVDELFELADRTTATCENLPNRLEYLKSLQSVLSIGTKQIQDTITALAQYLSKRKVLLPLSSPNGVSTLSSSSTSVEAEAVESASSNENESNDVEPESSLPSVASKESFLSAVSSSSIETECDNMMKKETERDNMMKKGTNFFLASPQRNPSPYSSDDVAVFASKSSSDDRPATFQPDSPVAVKPTANLKRQSMPAPSSSTDLLSSSTSAFQSLSLQSPQQRKSLSFISKFRALGKEPSTTPFVDSAALKRSLSNYFDKRNGSPAKRQRSIADDVIYGSLYCVLGEDEFEKKNEEEEDLDVIAYGLNCPIADCPSKAIQPNMLTEHMKEVHGKTSYVCLVPTCSQEFATL